MNRRSDNVLQVLVFILIVFTVSTMLVNISSQKEQLDKAVRDFEDRWDYKEHKHKGSLSLDHVAQDWNIHRVGDLCYLTKKNEDWRHVAFDCNDISKF